MIKLREPTQSLCGIALISDDEQISVVSLRKDGTISGGIIIFQSEIKELIKFLQNARR